MGLCWGSLPPPAPTPSHTDTHSPWFPPMHLPSPGTAIASLEYWPPPQVTATPPQVPPHTAAPAEQPSARGVHPLYVATPSRQQAPTQPTQHPPQPSAAPYAPHAAPPTPAHAASAAIRLPVVAAAPLPPVARVKEEPARWHTCTTCGVGLWHGQPRHAHEALRTLLPKHQRAAHPDLPKNSPYDDLEYAVYV